jgi:hypothetical protein
LRYDIFVVRRSNSPEMLEVMETPPKKIAVA